MKAIFWLLFVAASSSAFAEAIVGVAVPTTPQTLGTTFTVNIDVLLVSDLYAWQADLDYNASLLSVVSVSEGSLLSNAGPTFFIAGTNEPTNGVIANNADTLYTTIPGASGTGTLFSVQFKAVNPGVASFSIDNGTLLDSNLDSIDFAQTVSLLDINPPSVKSGAPGAAPEPAAFGLMLVSIGLVGVIRRRAKKVG
jgi:hypothetical protein